MKIFEDLLVVELSSVLAGPMVGSFFSELGAKVIKIENKTTNGDVTRQWKLNTEPEGEYSAYYCSANYNKQSILLDLKVKEDLAIVYKYCKKADIVISNFKIGVAEKLGVDFNTLMKFNNRLIYSELTGFSSSSKRPAFDVVLQAETGFMFMNGETNGNPVKMPVALIDILAAHQLKEAILIALLQRTKTGKGCKVETSLFETAVSSLANQATNWLMANHIPKPMGSLHPNIAPYGEQFLTKDDKRIVLAVGNNKQFSKLCSVLNIDDVASKEDFLTNTERVANRCELYEILKVEIEKNNAATLLQLLESNEVPAGLIRNMKEVFELPLASKMIQEETLSDGTKAKRIKTTAFKIGN